MPTLREIFSNIADAIRTKTGKSDSIYPVDMASEIEGISSGGGYKLEKMPSGAVSSFNDGTDLPLNKLKVSIEPVQSGSGDPSLTNVRPISGWSGANIVVSPTTDAEDGTTYNIQFKDGDNPLTVYGGTLDVINGVLTVKKAYVDLGTLDWVNAGMSTTAPTGHHAYVHNGLGAKYAGSDDITSNLICSQYVAVTRNATYKGTAEGFSINANGDLFAYISDYATDTASVFKTAMNGVQLVYELATPITYQLTPTAVKSLFGNNNIWADTGDIINGEYFKGAESGGGQLTQIEAFESGSVSLIATNGVTISSYTINEDMSADITFSESSAGYEGCILGSFENLEIGKSYLLKFEYEFNDAQIMAGYCLGAGIVENPVNDYENANQFNNFVRDSNRHSILLFFDYNFLNTNLVLNLSALDDAQVNKFKLENIRIYEIDSNI